MIALILGGARSGKSSLAEELAGRGGGRVSFIATAEAHDEEMRHRIAVHRANRPADWTTIEEPLDLAGAVETAGRDSETIVVDCLTLWVSNHLCRLPALDEGWPEVVARLGNELNGQISAVVRVARATGTTLLVVSNEVGLGLVPPNALSRAYRDLLGGVNRGLAAEADRLLLMVAGVAVDLKRLAAEL